MEIDFFRIFDFSFFIPNKNEELKEKIKEYKNKKISPPVLSDEKYYQGFIDDDFIFLSEKDLEFIRKRIDWVYKELEGFLVKLLEQKDLIDFQRWLNEKKYETIVIRCQGKEMITFIKLTAISKIM